MRYEVAADLYDGPLELLVELVKLDLVDVVLLKLMELTGCYREELAGNRRTLDEAAEPLPLFGALLALKARILLPQPAQAEEDEEPPISLEELERRLKEYERFKTVAQLLAELHALQHQRFTRPPGGATAADSSPEASAGLEVGVADLMRAFAKVLQRASAPVYEVAAEPWTVEAKARELRVLLTVKRRVRFFDLFTPQQTKLELVVTFLALLELMREQVASAMQERPFADILIVACEPVEAAPVA
jgi:segregation and condensation protein A